MSVADKLTLEKAVQALDKVKAEYEIENCRLAIITPDRYKETYDILANDFIPDESLSNAFGVTWNKDFEPFTLANLQCNISVCMISKDTNEIMGIRVTGIIKSSDPPLDLTVLAEPIRNLVTFIHQKDAEVNFFDRYGVDEAVHFFALGVKKKYRRMGLGGKLFAAAVAMSRELGFTVIKGEGTSNFSQRIYEKEGFETLVTMPYDSYMYQGRPIIEKTGEHTSAKVYGLKFE